MQRTTKKDGGGERKKPAPPWPDGPECGWPHTGGPEVFQGPKSADPVPDPLGDDDDEDYVVEFPERVSWPDTKPIPY